MMRRMCPARHGQVLDLRRTLGLLYRRDRRRRGRAGIRVSSARGLALLAFAAIPGEAGVRGTCRGAAVHTPHTIVLAVRVGRLGADHAQDVAAVVSGAHALVAASARVIFQVAAAPGHVDAPRVVGAKLTGGMLAGVRDGEDAVVDVVCGEVDCVARLVVAEDEGVGIAGWTVLVREGWRVVGSASRGTMGV